MIVEELIALDRHPDCRLLLTAYHARQIVAIDGWVERLTEVAGLDSALLSRLHGRLIALGMLEFELGGRGDGMRYQLSPLGARALQGPRGGGESSDEEDESEETAVEQAERV